MNLDKKFVVNAEVLRHIVAMSINHGFAVRDLQEPEENRKSLDPTAIENATIQVMAEIAKASPVKPERLLFYGAKGEVLSPTEH